jgi:hypothetical protein
VASLASSLRGRAEYRDFSITNTDSELSINTSYYEVDPDYGYTREVTQSLSIRPNGDAFSAEALVYTEDGDEADESTYPSDLLASIKTDEDALKIAQDYMATIRQEMEDGIKKGTASLNRSDGFSEAEEEQSDSDELQVGNDSIWVHENARMESNEALGVGQPIIDSLEDVERRIRRGSPNESSITGVLKFGSARVSKNAWSVTKDGTNSTVACVFVGSYPSRDEQGTLRREYFVGEINQDRTDYASDERYGTQREALKAAERRAIAWDSATNLTKEQRTPNPGRSSTAG